jgi:hypothetical protein
MRYYRSSANSRIIFERLLLQSEMNLKKQVMLRTSVVTKKEEKEGMSQ